LSIFLPSIPLSTIVRKIDHSMNEHNQFPHIARRLSFLFFHDDQGLFANFAEDQVTEITEPPLFFPRNEYG
jgi:hypothetical protein